MSIHKPVSHPDRILRNSVSVAGDWSTSVEPVGETFYLLKEDGDALLLETGDHLLKEDAV